MSSARTTRTDRGLRRIVKRVGKADGMRAVAGIFPGSKPGSSDTHPSSGAVGLPIATIAALLHYKSPTGKRHGKHWPWMRIAFAANLKRYRSETVRGMGRVLGLQIAPRGVLARVGVMMARDQVKALTALRVPALEPSTIQRKKSSNPLIDTGTLRNAHGSEVRGILD